MSEPYDQHKKRLHKIMLIMSCFFPSAVAVSIFLRVITRSYEGDYFLYASIIFLGSSYLGWYLYRRSKSLKVNIWNTVVDPEEWGPFDIPIDWLVSLALFAVFVFSIFAR